jgi:hypothetical protein
MEKLNHYAKKIVLTFIFITFGFTTSQKEALMLVNGSNSEFIMALLMLAMQR